MDGVYTRDVPQSAIHSQSSPHRPSASCLQSAVSSVEACSEHASVTVASPRSAAVSTSTSTQLSSSSSAACVSTSQLSVPTSSLSSAPVKTGILPPSANVNTNASSVVAGISGPGQQHVNKSALQSVSQADKGWTEFEEALSEEFISFSPRAGSLHQSKDTVTSSCILQPPKPPSLMMLSTASIYSLHFACFNVFSILVPSNCTSVTCQTCMHKQIAQCILEFVCVRDWHVGECKFIIMCYCCWQHTLVTDIDIALQPNVP